jgi:carbonic anhydrase
MKAIVAAHNDDPPHGTLLSQWLQCADLSDICDLVLSTHPSDQMAPHDRLSQGNIVRQLHNLMTYPSVRSAVKDNRLRLIAMYFDTTTANIQFLENMAPRSITADPESQRGHRFVRRRPDAHHPPIADRSRP